MAGPRDASRRRTTRYVAPETGRVHHLGQAPPLQPVVSEEGVAYVEASDVVLRRLMTPQVEQLAADLRRRMAAAAEALEFEEAGRLRDEVAAAEAELAKRQAEPTG